MEQVDLFFTQVPPVTRVYLVSATVLMALCTLEVISPFSLYMNWQLVFAHGQVWRLLTCFLFFGTFSLHFFWNVYVLIFYCSTLEEHRRSATFLWMLLCTGSMLLVSLWRRLIAKNSSRLRIPWLYRKSTLNNVWSCSGSFQVVYCTDVLWCYFAGILLPFWSELILFQRLYDQRNDVYLGEAKSKHSALHFFYACASAVPSIPICTAIFLARVEHG